LKRLLLTGATGFIGKNFIESLNRKYDITGVFRSLASTFNVDVAYVPGDVSNPNQMHEIFVDVKPDIVVHLAAKTIVRDALEDPYSTFMTNVIGLSNVLKEAAEHNVERILISTTDKIYGNGMFAHEGAAYNHGGYYETSKVCQEYVARSFYFVKHIPIIITRPCNVYGPGDMHPRIVPNVIRECLQGKVPNIFEQTKNVRREYIYVADVVDALDFLLENADLQNKDDEFTKHHVFNIASGDVKKQVEVVRTIAGKFSLAPNVTEAPNFSKFEIEDQSLNCEKINALGWKARVSFNFGLDLTISWWKNRGV